MSSWDGLKFQRVCQLAMEDVNNKWVAFSPFITIRGRIQRGQQQGGVPDATFYLVNVDPALRQTLYKDSFRTKGEDPIQRQVSFWAGYSDTYFNDFLSQHSSSTSGSITDITPPPPGCAILFIGYLDYCRTYRQGTDWITEVHCWDGGIAANAAFSQGHWDTGTNVNTIIQKLAADFSEFNVSVTRQATVSSTQLIITPKAAAKMTPTTKPTTISGPAWKEILELIRDVPGVAISLDLNVIKVATWGEGFVTNNPVDLPPSNSKPIDGAFIIDDSQGIIGIPWSTSVNMQIETMLLTSVKLWDIVYVQTSKDYGNPAINGNHLVLSVEHNFTISQFEEGEARTVLILQMGNTPAASAANTNG